MSHDRHQKHQRDENSQHDERHDQPVIESRIVPQRHEKPFAEVPQRERPQQRSHDEDGRRGSATSSLVSGACILSGARVDKSLLFTGVHAHSYSEIEHCVIMPYVHVNRGARLIKCVIDKDVIIPRGLVVGEDPELDAKRFRRTENGICLITQDMIDRLQL